MKTPLPDYLAEIRDLCSAGASGELADYIPELASVDPDRFAVAACMTDGVVYATGDDDVEFTIQSMSKPFIYALALNDSGVNAVLEKVAVEPSGDAFNDISVETSTGRPLNPMINIGAITMHSLVGVSGATGSERDARIAEGLSAFAGRPLEVDEAVLDSELGTAFRNVALANLVRAAGILTVDPGEAVRGYTRQCAYRVTVRDLAVMAATLATGGVNPITDEQVVSPRVCRQVLAVMATCGMYDAAGDWMSTVGIPAKSGVSGGIFGSLPGQVGLGVFSPRLDRHGHSVEGVRAFERLSRDMDLHLMTPRGSDVEAVSSVEVDEVSGALTVTLQGPLDFASAERVLRRLSEIPAGEEVVTLNLRMVSAVNHTARRMVGEAMSRLTEDGHPVQLTDPAGLLPGPLLDLMRRPGER